MLYHWSWHNIALLYVVVHQTINQLVDFISEQITTAAAGAAPAAATEEEHSEEEGDPAALLQRRARPSQAVAAATEAEKPSELLKLLRAAPSPRPLFLAAPGVANAQSAYFAFSQFLTWSDQPIYVLEKDNDLNIHDLARQNAKDILKVRPGQHGSLDIEFLLNKSVAVVLPSVDLIHTLCSIRARTARTCRVRLTQSACATAPTLNHGLLLLACTASQVQPEGPYLLGGHSYGGLVAMEIAAVLESWGYDVGLVIIMDTPRPEQVGRYSHAYKAKQ